jgi:NADPH:quinone reductase-like Zn-dependent oxidoreductase
MLAAIMVPGPEGGVWDIREVQRPVVQPGHILARVYASSLNRAKMWAMRKLRAMPGQRVPAERTGGGDAAGEAIEIGDGVTGFQPGDRVMGRCTGGFAEYALIDAREAMPAPERLA